MLAQDRPKSHGMTTVFKDYALDYRYIINVSRVSEFQEDGESFPIFLNDSMDVPLYKV